MTKMKSASEFHIHAELCVMIHADLVSRWYLIFLDILENRGKQYSE
jgi:hypothetical protein